MKFSADLVGDIAKTMGRIDRMFAKASKDTAKEAGDGLKEDLRRQVKSAGLGRKLANTWRGKVYPDKGQSKDSAAIVYSKAPKIIRSFDQGVTIRSDSGFFLAIPTENAPKKGTDGKRISPSNFNEHRYGKLRFVYRPNGPSLLVVDNVGFSAKTGRVTRQRKGGAYTKSGKLRKGVSTAVMFILVPQIKLRKRLDAERPFLKWARRYPSLLKKNLAEAARGNKNRTNS